MNGTTLTDNFRITNPLPLPQLLVAAAGTVGGFQLVQLTWTNNGSWCVLQSAGALTGSWNTVSTPWTTNANWVSTVVTNLSPAQFYRLRAN